MASTTWPDGSPKSVDDIEYEVLGSAWAGDGILGTTADTAAVYADGTSGLAVKFRANKYGLVHGHGWASGASDITKSVTANLSGQPRIDLAVLGLDRTTWLVTEYIKAGVAGSTPSPPSLQRDSILSGTGKWEIPVARIAVASGATAIGASDVTPVATILGPAQILYVANQTALDSIPSPIHGQLAYLASAAAGDHPFLHYQTGTGWRRLDWNNAWGILGGHIYTGSGNLFYFAGSMTDTGLRTGAVPLLNGRRYAVELSAPVGYSASGSDPLVYHYFQVAKAGGATIGDAPCPPVSIYQAWLWQRTLEYVPTVDESLDFALSAFAGKVSGSATLYWAAVQRHDYNTYFRVRDLGPAGKLTVA